MSFTRNKVTAVLGTAIAIGGIGAGVALGIGDGSSASPPAVVSAPGTNEVTTPQTGAPEPAGPDTDTLQEGDQTTPDGPNEKAEAKEPAETNEKAEANEPVEANEPAGGHEDAPGAEVDHQNEGVE